MYRMQLKKQAQQKAASPSILTTMALGTFPDGTGSHRSAARARQTNDCARDGVGVENCEPDAR